MSTERLDARGNTPAMSGYRLRARSVLVMTMAILTLPAVVVGVGVGDAGAKGAVKVARHSATTTDVPVSAATGDPAAATSAQIDALTVTPQTVLAGTEFIITIQFSGGSPQDHFGAVITDLNDDFDPFSCSEMLVSGTATAGTDQEVCPVPATAYIGNYDAQGVIFSPGPPPSVVFSGGEAAFAVVASQQIAITTASLPNGNV